MKKKAFQLILLPLLSLSLLTACGGKKEDASQESPVLNVGIVRADDRYSYEENGELKGIESDLAKKAAEIYGKDVNIKSAGSDTELYSGLQDGSFDLVFGRIPETQNALNSFMVSDNYGKSGLYFVTKKYDYTDSLSLLRSGSIGIMGSVKPISDQIPGISSFSVNDYTDIEALSRDVASGTISVGICGERDALSIISADIQVQEMVKGPSEYYVAALKNDNELKNAVNSAISAYYDSLYSGTADTSEESILLPGEEENGETE